MKSISAIKDHGRVGDGGSEDQELLTRKCTSLFVSVFVL